jgi:hypothetical protein
MQSASVEVVLVAHPQHIPAVELLEAIRLAGLSYPAQSQLELVELELQLLRMEHLEHIHNMGWCLLAEVVVEELFQVAVLRQVRQQSHRQALLQLLTQAHQLQAITQ